MTSPLGRPRGPSTRGPSRPRRRSRPRRSAPPRRTPPERALRPLALAVLAAAALPLLSAGCGAPDRPVRDAWRGRVLDEPIARPDFVLTDTGGEPYDFRGRTEGKVALVFVGYTNCPDVCPVHLANLGAVLDDLSHETARRIEVVFITADPERDTPERIRSWLDGHHPDFVGLRGTVDEVHRIERALGLPPSVVDGHGEDAFVGHAAQVLAFGPDGPARLAFPWGTRQADLRADLPRLARGEVPGSAGSASAASVPAASSDPAADPTSAVSAPAAGSHPAATAAPGAAGGG